MLVPIHPVRPPTNTKAAIPTIILLKEARLFLSRNGNRRNPRASVPSLLNISEARFDLALLLANCTDSATFVAPAPAGIDAGENTAVAPGGSPVTLNVMGAPKVEPLVGVIGSGMLATPPGEATIGDETIPVEPPPVEPLPVEIPPVLGVPIVKLLTTITNGALVTATKLLSPE